MQKSTIFTVLLSMLVVFTMADLLVKKPLSQELSANTLQEEKSPMEDAGDVEKSKKNDATVTEIGGISFETPAKNSSAATVTNVATAPALPDVSSFLEKRSFFLSKITPDDLQKAGFQNMKLEEAPFDRMLFQLLDLSSYRNLSVLRMHLTDAKNIFGVLHEFEFERQGDAATLYADLKQKIGAFSPLVTSNETNQYGENSYYMNDKNRPGTAFLVFRIRSHVFAFSYPKASHEFFKSLILSLAKR